MVAPGPGVAGTTLAGASDTTAPIAVPAGVTSGQIILVDLYLEASRTVTPPSGFTEIGTVAATSTTWHHRFWKRATGSDAGTYSFSWTGATYRRGAAVRYPGCVATGTPYDTGAGAPVSAARSSAGTVTPGVSLTTQGVDRLLVWSGTSFSFGSWTQPTAGGTWTERYDSNEITGAEKSQAVAGATGTVTGTSSASDSQTAWLLALIPGDVAVVVDDSQPAAIAAGSPSGESVEALSINLTVDTDPTAATITGAPGGETVSVDLADPTPAGVVHGAAGGELVSVTVDDAPPAATVVGSPPGETVDAEEPGLPAGGAPFVSLWAVDPDTGALIHLPHALKVDLSPIRNSPGSFRFDYPAFGKNFEFLHDRMIGDKVAVELQLWVGGSRFNSLGGDVLQVEGDDVAEESVWSFSGKFFTHRLARATVRHDPAHEKGERQFSVATAGTIMRTFLLEAQARGTLTYLDLSTFSTTHDSVGVPWSRTATLSFTPYGDGGVLTVLSRLVALGMCEGEVDRDKRLLLYNAGGAGRDLTTRTPPVILRRAKDLLESNRRLDVGESGTDVYGTGGEGLYASAFDASARARWGEQIEMVADSNQIKDQGALTAFVQNARDQAVLAPMELTHGLVFGTNRPAPVSGFRINDWLYSDVGRGLERVRVAQWVLSQDVSGIKGSVTLNDIIADRLTRLQRQIAAMADGSAVVGTSTASPVDDTMPPAAPTGLVVDSNIAYQVPEHTNTLAELIVGWAPVATNADGSATDDVDSYRVQYTYLGMDQVGTILDPGPGYDPGPLHWIEPSGSPTRDLFLRFGDVEADAEVAVRVAAIDRTGNQSAWSASLELTTAADDTAPEAPSAPGQSIWFRTLDTAWDGLDFAGAPMAADFDHVAVLMSQAATFDAPDPLGEPVLFDPLVTGVQHVANLYGAGTWNQPDLPVGVGWYSALVAVDRAGNVSAMSAITGPAAAEKLVQIDIGPDAIGRQQVIDLEVVRAKVENLLVNSAKVEEINVGLLTAGTMTATVTNSGLFRTASSGNRVEFDSAGIRLYMGSTVVGRWQTSDASMLMTGTYMSALSGERIQMDPDGSARWYGTSGSDYASIQNIGADLLFRSRADGSGRRSYLAYTGSGLGISWGTESTRYSGADFGVTYGVIRAGVCGVRMLTQHPTTDSTEHRFHVLHANSGGDLSNTIWHFRRDSAGYGVLHGALQDSGMKSIGGVVWLTKADGSSWAPVRAESFLEQSSITSKRNVVDVAAGVGVRASDLVRRVRIREWERTDEAAPPRPAKPGVKLRRTEIVDGVEREWFEDAEWDWEEPARRKQYGPIAEELEAVAPSMVVTCHITGHKMLDLLTVASTGWAASAENADDIDALRSTIGDLQRQVDHLRGVVARRHSLVVDGELVDRGE